jgi:hypothetical protein
VQRGAELLQLLADAPFSPLAKYKPGDLACFLSHLSVPAQAEVWFGDRRVQAGSPTAPALVPADTAVYVRMADAVIGVRFILTETVDGRAAAIQYIADDRRAVAHRLTVEHTAAPQAGRGITAVWMRAAEGLAEDQFAEWRRRFAAAPVGIRRDGDRVELRAAGEQGELVIDVDLARRERRALAGGEPEALLSVNGRDLGRELLGTYRR